MDAVRNFAQHITVEPVLLFYMSIIIIETNVFQSLFATKVCMETHPVQNCSSKYATSLTDADDVALWMKYYSACLFFCTLIVSFYVASWSDYYSRKVVMIIPPIGTFIAASINLTLSLFIDANIAYYLVSASVSGLSFGTLGIISSTFGFLSDIVPEESRTVRIIVLEMMIFIGGTIGSQIGGAILKHGNMDSFVNEYAIVFIVEMVIAAAIILYIAFRIPYMLSSSHELSMHSEQTGFCSQLFKFDHIKDAVRTVFKRRIESKRRTILLLFISLIFIYYGFIVQLTLSYIYVSHTSVNWNFTQYSNYNSLLFATQSVGMILVSIFLHFCKNVPDVLVAIVAVLSRLAGFVLFGLSTTGNMVYLCCLLFVFSELAVPSVRSMLSKLVDENEKGKIFAFSSFLQNLCFFSASFILITIFQSTFHTFPGLCFEIVAGLQFLSLIIFIYLYFASKLYVTRYEIMDNGAIARRY